MTRILPAFLAVMATILLLATMAQAQSDDDVVWVQIEAQPSLRQATDRARVYAAQLEDVNGFALGGGWYGIAVGPYRRADALVVLRSYVRDRIVPRDSFIQTSDAFRQQFWPVGANVLNRGVLDAPASVDTPAVTAEPQAPVVTPEPPAASDETVAEARRSERDLTADERKALQIALQWAGFYNAAIDGAFGRGTRNSMAAWQEANNFEVTGVLTTAQRAALIGQYNAVLDGLDLKFVRDDQAGIEIVMPTAEVAFARYEAPFAHYDSTGDIGARVILISQTGDQATLFGLYDILQTLEIIPVSGPRERRNSSFEIKGENSRIVSETRVSLENGEVKGFTLVWPAGDEERRTRVLAEMVKSFTRLPGALDPAAGSDAEQAIDLVSGLQVRQPRLSRSGFFIDGQGTVLTTSDVTAGCSRLTVDGETEARVLAEDGRGGAAILKPQESLAPMAVAAFSLDAPRLQSEVSVAGYSYGGVLSAATLTFGKLADIRGLNGEEDLSRLDLIAQPGDAGGPVFDASGNVVGMLLSPPSGGPELPKDVSFALDTPVIAALAAQAGVSLSERTGTGAMAPRDLRLAAQGMTVLVSCWD